MLSNSPQTARRSILLAPPANAFSGLWSSVRRRHGFPRRRGADVDPLRVPDRVPQQRAVPGDADIPHTQRLHVVRRRHRLHHDTGSGVCSFFVRWPRRMPVDPSTIAGAMSTTTCAIRTCSTA
ncbi:hypothetical protein F5X96DRAFT_45226 [Biscogniauxia mediterranea]|nr:hypothetical protein F5X96DRAFT_45226 [Biscogniauxia mediterranea]